MTGVFGGLIRVIGTVTEVFGVSIRVIGTVTGVFMACAALSER